MLFYTLCTVVGNGKWKNHAIPNRIFCLSGRCFFASGLRCISKSLFFFYCLVTNALSAYNTKIRATCRSAISITFRNLVGESYIMFHFILLFKVEGGGGGVGGRGGEVSPLMAENADLS